MIDLRNKSVALQIINEMNQSENLDRRRESFKSFQVYSGNIETYTEEELQRTRPKSWKSYTIANVSLSKMVNDKISQSYDIPPRRFVAADEDLKNQKTQEIYEEADANRQMQEFDLLFNRQRYALLWVNYREMEQRYQFMSLAGYECAVVRNKDTGELEAVVLNYGDLSVTTGSRGENTVADGKSDLIAESQIDSSASSRTYVMWSKDFHVKWIESSTEGKDSLGRDIVKKDITYVPIEGNKEGINKLGMIPFVFRSKDNSVDLPTINPITQQSVTYSALMSEALTSANIQGTGTLVIEYPEKYQGKFDRMETGLTSVIESPQSSDPDDAATKVDYINPSPSLDGQIQVYTAYLRQVLSEHGLKNSKGMDGQSNESFSSALERMVANADVQKIINKNQLNYESVEKDAFEIVKAYEELITQGKSVFDSEDELQIIYPKPKVMISDAETLQNIKQRMDMGLMEKWEALVALDPNLTEKQAKERTAEIEMNQQNSMRGFLGVGIQSEPSQQNGQA